MANIKSAQKRIKVIETKTIRNRMIKSSLKTAVKKFEVALTTGNAEESKTTLLGAIRSLDMAASKGVIHKNKSARTKSRLSAKLKNLNA